MRHQQGFTLIEVLLALALSSILVLSSWQLIKHLQNVQARQQARVQQLLALHAVYSTMQADFKHAVAWVHSPSGLPAEAAIDIPTPTAIYVSVAGTTEAVQRVSYSVKQNKLIRSVENLNDYPAASKTELVLLQPVEAMNVAALNPSPTAQWPEEGNDTLTALPQAIQIQLSTDSNTQYTWLFTVPHAN